MILHNDGAVNFTLTEAPVSDPTRQRTLIPHRDDVRLDGVDAFAGHLVVSYRREALPRIQLWPIDSDGGYGEPEEISFDSELMSIGPGWQSDLGFAQAADQGGVFDHPGADLRHRLCHR